MEGQEAISNLFRLFLSENVSGPDPRLIPCPSEGYEASPSIIPAEEIQTGPPTSSRHFQPPGLHRHRWGGPLMCRPRCELLFEVCIQVGDPIRQPHLEWRQGDDLLDIEEEGGQWVFSQRDTGLSSPNPGPRVEGPDRFLWKDGNQGMGLTTSVLPIASLQFRILRYQPMRRGIPGGAIGSTLECSHWNASPQWTTVPPRRGGTEIG